MMINNRTLAGLWMLTCLGAAAPVAAQQLTGVDMQLTAVEDSGSYLVYRYHIGVAAGSTNGIAQVIVDLADPGAGFAQLPSTGTFFYGPSTASVPTAEHAPIGTISPLHWEAYLSADATLAWYGSRGGAVNEDSIPPGSGLAGFGLRSTYLPGIRSVSAEPTWQSCCSEPDPASEVEAHPDAGEFAVVGATVAPTVAPAEVEEETGVVTLIADVDELCALEWIDDEGVCNSLRVKLEQAQASIIADRPAAIHQLQAFLNELDAQRGAHVNENAYWLMRVLGEHVLSTI